MLNSIRQSIRSLGRPILSATRRVLTPAPPKKTLQPVAILEGAAAGMTIELPCPSVLAEKISSGKYETHCVTACTLFVEPDDVCLDIGAHYGFYTLLLSRLTQNGHVHAFEPVPRLAQSVERSVELSKRGNVTVHKLGLSDSIGKLTLRYAACEHLDDSMNYLAEHGGVPTDRSRQQYPGFSECPIDCRTLDDLGLTNVKFIKLDAEGSEAAILKGGRKLLASCRPRLLVELHGVDLALQVSGLLRDLGYMSLTLGARDLIMPVLFIHLRDDFAVSVMNYLLGEDVRNRNRYPLK